MPKQLNQTQKDMKKVLFSLLLAMATFAANATTPDEIFTMFKQMPNA